MTDARLSLPLGVRFRPTACRIAVKLDPRRETFVRGGNHPAAAVSPERLESGLIAVGAYDETPCTGVVVAVGPGIPESPMLLAVGQRVLLGKYNGTPIPGDYFGDTDPAAEYVLLDARHDKPKPHVPEVYGELLNDATPAPAGKDLKR
jgi:hypothetical protein